MDPKGDVSREQPRRRLEDPDKPGTTTARIIWSGDAAAQFFAALKSGAGDASITAHIDAAIRNPVTLRNVIGVLRGSDLALRDSCILLTAHYDHLGMLPDGAAIGF